MGKLMGKRWNLINLWWFGVVTQILFLLAQSQNLEGFRRLEKNVQAASRVLQLIQQNRQVVMSNGLVSVTVRVPHGVVSSVTYRGSDNLLQSHHKSVASRGYWDVVWNKPGDRYNYTIYKFLGTKYNVITQNEDQVEISFITKWEAGSSGVPLNADQRYVMLKDSPGFYSYVILERLKGWPAYEIGEGRLAFKLNPNKFHYMAVSDERQRIMPMARDFKRGRTLDYKEAVVLTRSTNPQLRGEVDDKYLYSCDNKDNKVHGWVSSNPAIGFWMITPSNEFRTGGPFKQDLTSHTGPTLLSMFISVHYAGGDDLSLKFENEEYWKKVFGPVFIYLNSNSSAKTNPSILWEDAKHKMQEEVASWPYSFPLSNDFVKSNQRGSLRGQLLVHDWYKNSEAVPAASAYVGLAPPGERGSWQFENKGYQFWTETDQNGSFSIKNVIPGTYSLFATVLGIVGDFKHVSDINITSASNVDVGNVVFEAPRNGPTLWEIGIPDRIAAEFFIPDPSLKFKIHPYPKPVEKFRQYGLWERYKDYYPETDLVYTIGQSNYSKDWFYAHVTRNIQGPYYDPTTWQIRFDLKDVDERANYTLQLALASVSQAELQVRVNYPNSTPLFTTGLMGNDNAVGRHGIHGLYRYYSIGVEGSRLVEGMNTIFLKQKNSGSPFREVMYDYIRLEGPAPSH